MRHKQRKGEAEKRKQGESKKRGKNRGIRIRQEQRMICGGGVPGATNTGRKNGQGGRRGGEEIKAIAREIRKTTTWGNTAWGKVQRE